MMVFVTGGTGFLGAYVIKQLVEQGHQVRALRRSDRLPFFVPAPVFDQVEWINGDILDTVGLEEAMDGADAVIHAAAHVSFVSDDKTALFQTNIDGTANMVNTALALSIKRFVHVSSVAALGRTADSETVSEDKQWQESRLNTNYGISKYRAEMEVWRAIGEGLPAVIVNPSTLIGYGDWNASSCAIFKSVYEDFPWYSKGVNGFADVEDAAKLIVLLLESSISGERFVVNGDNWSFERLFNAIADGFGKKHPDREATPLLAAVAWRYEKMKSLITRRPSLLTRESARIAQTRTYFNNLKIQRFLPGFSYTALDDTILRACRRYIAQQAPA